MSARSCNGLSCVTAADDHHQNKPISSSAAASIQKQKSSRKPQAQEHDNNHHHHHIRSSSSSSPTRTCNFRLPYCRKKKDLSPLKYLKHLGCKIVGVVRIIYPKRTSPRVTNSSSTASSSSSSSSSERPKPSKIAAPHPVIDSHRAEAIDDCIEFINSSSSLPRSNSTTQ